MGFLSGLFGDKRAKEGYQQGAEALQAGKTEALGYLSPYRDFGQGYLANLRDMQEFRAPTMEEVEQTPGYQFRLGEGKRAIENSAIARGGLLSGNALRDILGYGQNYASNEYDKAYGRRSDEYQNELARLMNFANMGQSAAGASANAALGAGNNLANLYVQRGQDLAQRSPWNKFNAIVDTGNKIWEGFGSGMGAFMGMR